jgi:hypothetical protein
MAMPWADGILDSNDARWSLLKLKNPVLLRFLTFCVLQRVGNVAGTISGVDVPDDVADNMVSNWDME